MFRGRGKRAERTVVVKHGTQFLLIHVSRVRDLVRVQVERHVLGREQDVVNLVLSPHPLVTRHRVHLARRKVMNPREVGEILGR